MTGLYFFVEPILINFDQVRSRGGAGGVGVVASKNQVCLVNSDAVVFNLNDVRVQKGFSLTNPNLIRVVRRCGWSGSQVETDVCVKLKVPVQPMLRRRPRQAAAGPGAKSSVSQNCCALLPTVCSSALFTLSTVHFLLCTVNSASWTWCQVLSESTAKTGV